MTAVVYTHTQQIGTTQLHVDGSAAHCVRGILSPNDNFKGWTNGQINVQLENGYFLFMNDNCTITVKRDDNLYEVVLNNLSNEVMEYIREGDTEIFVHDPWSSISIEQKIGLEDELLREVKNRKRSFFGMGRNTNTHHLAGHKISALCKADMNDDVLFIVRNSDGRDRYALVHLTWNNNKEESPSFPTTIFFDTFEDFKNACYEDQ